MEIVLGSPVLLPLKLEAGIEDSGVGAVRFPVVVVTGVGVISFFFFSTGLTGVGRDTVDFSFWGFASNKLATTVSPMFDADFVRSTPD